MCETRLVNETLLLRVRHIIRETSDAATFLLEPVDASAAINYQAGQFLTLIFERRGKELRRSYSLSSAPGIDPWLSITVKQVENGEISRYLLSAVKTGDVLKSLFPAGRFTLPEAAQPGSEVFLLAAGSGIVPVFSILKAFLYGDRGSRITLIYSNRDEHCIIFHQELKHLAETFPDQFQLLHLLSQPGSGKKLPSGYQQGHLNNQLLEQLLARYLQNPRGKARFFICGPFSYMRMVQITLRVSGIKESQLHKENFVVNEPVLERFEFPEGPYPKRVEFSGALSYSLQVAKKQTILDAALQTGITLPYSCKAGLCSTCMARCRGGRVKMSVNEVLTAKDVEDGLVLTCVAYPITEEVALEI